MGQMQDKCSCMFIRKDKDTMKMEYDSENEKKNLNPFINQKSFTFKDKILRTKNKDSAISHEDYTLANEDKLFEVRNALKLPENVEIPLEKVIIFQSVFRGFLYRKSFSIYKKSLKEYEDDLISRCEKTFKMNCLNKSEITLTHQYNREGWKEFKLDPKFFNFNYGKIYRTRIRFFGSNNYYTGEMNINNEKHGFGELINISGIKKEGFWRNNIFIGWGRLTDHDGIIFEGVFQNGLLNGKGRRIAGTKGTYSGDFKNGMRHGFGVEDTSEHIYEGQFNMDKKSGLGKLSYKKMNDTYIGEFTDNSITGNGIYTWANKDTFEGQFLNGKMHGRGIYKWPDGGEYTGEYINGIKEGRGRFKWSNGKIFDGPFKNGRPNGVGKLIFGDNIIDVEFKDGKLLKSPNLTDPSTNSTKYSSSVATNGIKY